MSRDREINPETPLWQLTVGEFTKLIEENNLSKDTNNEKDFTKDEKEYVYGLAGLAKIIGCSKNHASKLKGEGIFDEAIIQNGRKIIVERKKVLEILKNRSE